MRLLVVELRRLLARKVVLLTVLGAVAVAVVSLVGVANQARQLEAARAGADTEYQRMVDDNERMQEECRLAEADERRRSGDASVDFGCDDFQVPTIEEFFGQLPSMSEQLQFLLQGASYPLMFLALAIGSTAVAAEFAHRTMATWLTFVPRRTPVFVSKVVAPALAAAPVVLTGLVLLLVGTPLVYAVFGLDRSVPDGWGEPVWMSLRILLLGLAAAALGAGAAFLVRHTGVVLGLVIGWMFIVEGILGSSFAWVARLGLVRNVAAFVENGTSWSTFVDCNRAEGCREVVQTLSFAHGATVLGVVLGVVLLAAWARFRRADIS
ncbi:ABC transporter permease subunit [Ornithinimicrobium sp. W1665]|uniref:ABC transporter permease subunit n=1 Tax=Ornithinimicrobium sp. W1665 TaxID=3416666 RepID=UPI003CF4B873